MYTMKKQIILSSLLLVSFSFLNAQTTIQLIFTGNLSGIHISLDSIRVENITQGGDTTLYGLDTVLVLSSGIGVGYMQPAYSSNMVLHTPYPNPVTHQSNFELWLPQSGVVNIRLLDIQGREHAAFSRSLAPGKHTFTLSPGKVAVYWLVAEYANQQQTRKVISMRPEAMESKILHADHHQTLSTMRKGKSVFPWAPGDDLFFSGFASPGMAVIQNNPTQSSQHTFQFSHPGMPCPGIPTVTDINGNTYNTVLIGNQCWMKENLRVRNYRDGTPIPHVTNPFVWTNAVTGARCWYNNDSAAHDNIYGALYNWHATVDSAGLCPYGWQVPTISDWDTLVASVGGNSVGGGAIKALCLWNNPNTGATNSSGFSGLPGGFRDNVSAPFTQINNVAIWWSSTPLLFPCAYIKSANYLFNSLGEGNAVFNMGVSVRCIKGPLRNDEP
jgi:uncharacterized protein (TIGR02145 family)